MKWKKGQSGNPKGKPTGIKNGITILKEERRAIFDREMTDLFIQKIHQARAEYLLDQYLGPATTKIEHSGEIRTGVGLTDEEIEAIKEAAKKRLQNG